MFLAVHCTVTALLGKFAICRLAIAIALRILHYSASFIVYLNGVHDDLCQRIARNLKHDLNFVRCTCEYG